MKKVLFLISMSFFLLFSGCNFGVYDSENKFKNEVPSALINNTLNQNNSELTNLYNNCKKTVVTVLNYASYYDRGQVVTSLYGSGSGFIYSYDDTYIYLYTNAHVVDVGVGYNQSYYEIVFYDGYRSYGSLIYSDGSEDVAIMKVDRESQNFSIVAFANSDGVQPGEIVFALGSPLGLEYANTITQGIVSNVNVEMETDDNNDGVNTTMYMIQVDAALNPGNSGGPLFNKNGEVVGVNTLKLMTNSSGESVESFNFAIPINHFVRVANFLVKEGKYSRPKLGINVIDVVNMSLKERESYGIDVSKGLYIESIIKNSASYGILNSKEIVIEINDVQINNLGDFSKELYKYQSGDKIIITTYRSGRGNISYSIVLD